MLISLCGEMHLLINARNITGLKTMLHLISCKLGAKINFRHANLYYRVEKC